MKFRIKKTLTNKQLWRAKYITVVATIMVVGQYTIAYLTADAADAGAKNWDERDFAKYPHSADMDAPPDGVESYVSDLTYNGFTYTSAE